MRHKLLDFTNTEVKYDDARRKFSGYASVFGGVDSYGDTIIPGAYKSTLENRKRPVQLRWNHYGDIIGKWTEIREDEKGLWVEGELTPGHSKAEDVYALLKHGGVSGLSIGYRPVKSADNEHGGDDLYEIELIEISVVESPADIDAQVASVKSVIEKAETLKEIEALLRDVGGFSRGDATTLVSRVKTLTHGDRVVEEQKNEDYSNLVNLINASTTKLRGL